MAKYIRLRGRMKVGPETRRPDEQKYTLRLPIKAATRRLDVFPQRQNSRPNSVVLPQRPVSGHADANLLADPGTPNLPKALIVGHPSDADANKETIISPNAIRGVEGGQPNGNGHRDGSCTHPYPNRCGPTGRRKIN
jgi:hypothetical protein